MYMMDSLYQIDDAWNRKKILFGDPFVGGFPLDPVGHHVGQNRYRLLNIVYAVRIVGSFIDGSVVIKQDNLKKNGIMT